MTELHAAADDAGTTEFVGLAPFLRLSIAGMELLPFAREMQARLVAQPDDANLWMNLATLMLCLQQPELGLEMQRQALLMQRSFFLRAAQQPARMRLLVLAVPGDLSANMPLDCLLEDGNVDLIFHYLTDVAGLQDVPEHDMLTVGISACDEAMPLLQALVPALAAWPRPVFNAPQFIPNTERNIASLLLQGVPGLLICPALRASRAVLEAVEQGAVQIGEAFADCEFPVILRPVGSHGGRGLEKIDSPAAIGPYLANDPAAEFFLSRFVDYSGTDGLFRKARVALIDGVPYACHMAVSEHWMVHYVNAGMYEDAARRAEEAAFMADFAAFAERHREALAAIHARSGLDYVCLDCAETRDGRLMVFEIDHAMVVHAMDPEAMFPYKQAHMAKVREAFLVLLGQRLAEGCR